jgi:hypothetical protein
MLDKPATMTVSGGIQIVLGLWLSYVGYMS